MLKTKTKILRTAPASGEQIILGFFMAPVSGAFLFFGGCYDNYL